MLLVGQDSRGAAISARSLRDVTVYERQRTDHCLIPNFDTHLNDRAWADIDAVSDPCRLDFHISLAERSRPAHGIMRVDLHAGADTAIIADGEAAPAVENYVGANPRMSANFNVSQYKDVVIRSYPRQSPRIEPAPSDR